MDIWTIMRLVNGITGIAIGVVMIVVNHRRIRNKVIDAPDLLFRQGLVVYLLAGAYATIELARLGSPGGPRLIFITVGLIWMLVGIIRIEQRERKR